MCGEKMMKAGSNCAMLGSPPRMRGKVLKLLRHRLQLGITPAYAGKRLLQSSDGIREWDHPRMCGEKDQR